MAAAGGGAKIRAALALDGAARVALKVRADGVSRDFVVTRTPYRNEAWTTIDSTIIDTKVREGRNAGGARAATLVTAPFHRC